MESEKFEMTQDEMQRLQKALKDKEFLDMLIDYTKEISDPENKKRYEEEIIAMEKERGNKVQLLKPQPGFVVKTSRQSDDKKIFVNICSSDHIQVFSITPEVRNGKSGQHVSLPHSLSPMREDLDKSGKPCLVFDVCFHPDSYSKSLDDLKFKELLIETAFDTIEKQGKTKVDRQIKKLPKMKYKGTMQTNIIRPNHPDKVDESVDMEKHVIGKYKETVSKNGECTQQSPTCKDKLDSLNGNGETKKITPQYKIKHRGYFDMQNFTKAREDFSTIPKELVIDISLPLAKSASDINLDIFEKELILDGELPPYHLELKFPYIVNEAEGKAQFNTTEKVLTVTLPVIPKIENIDSIPTCPLNEKKNMGNGINCNIDDEFSYNIDKDHAEIMQYQSNLDVINGDLVAKQLTIDPSLKFSENDSGNLDGNITESPPKQDIDNISGICIKEDFSSNITDDNEIRKTYAETKELMKIDEDTESPCNFSPEKSVFSVNDNQSKDLNISKTDEVFVNGIEKTETLNSNYGNDVCKTNGVIKDGKLHSILKQSDDEGYSGIDHDVPTSSPERINPCKLPKKSALKRSESETDYCDTEDDFSSANSFKERFTSEGSRYVKSDGEHFDTEDDLSCSASSFKGFCSSSEQTNVGRRRVKSVTFDDKPSIFEFQKVTKKQLKKQRRQERNMLATESSEGEVSENEEGKKGRSKKKGKHEKRNQHYAQGSPKGPTSILVQKEEETEQKKKKKRKKKKKGDTETKQENSISSISDSAVSSDSCKETMKFNNQLIFELE